MRDNLRYFVVTTLNLQAVQAVVVVEATEADKIIGMVVHLVFRLDAFEHLQLLFLINTEYERETISSLPALLGARPWNGRESSEYAALSLGHCQG